MRHRQGFGPLELVVLIIIAVVVGILAKGCNNHTTPTPTPSPMICATYSHGITYCRQPPSATR